MISFCMACDVHGWGKWNPRYPALHEAAITATQPSPLHLLLYITSCVASDFLRCVVCVIASASCSRISLITGAQPHPDGSGNREIRLSPSFNNRLPLSATSTIPSAQFMAFPSPPDFWNNRGVWLSEQAICAKSCRVCPFALKSCFYQLCVDGRAWSVMCTGLSGLQRPRRLLHLFGLTRAAWWCRVIGFLCKPSNKSVAARRLFLSVFTGKKSQWPPPPPPPHTHTHTHNMQKQTTDMDTCASIHKLYWFKYVRSNSGQCCEVINTIHFSQNLKYLSIHRLKLK